MNRSDPNGQFFGLIFGIIAGIGTAVKAAAATVAAIAKAAAAIAKATAAAARATARAAARAAAKAPARATVKSIAKKAVESGAKGAAENAAIEMTQTVIDPEHKFDWGSIGLGFAGGFISGGFGAAAKSSRTFSDRGLEVFDSAVSTAVDFGLSTAAGTPAHEAARNAMLGAILGIDENTGRRIVNSTMANIAVEHSSSDGTQESDANRRMSQRSLLTPRGQYEPSPFAGLEIANIQNSAYTSLRKWGHPILNKQMQAIMNINR